ncbi:MAG: type IV pilin [Candidatus Thermoplasmatota archaeon]|nr:type IV pilin [Candidatus Thermoplasmatota archaeon]
MKIVIRDDEKKDKAVSAIIGTILIVAITVVLAATLYAVLGGFSGLIGKPTPTASMSVSVSGDGTSTAPFNYTLTFTSVSSALVISDVQVKVVSSNGSVYSQTFTAPNPTSDTFVGPLPITGSGYEAYAEGLTSPTGGMTFSTEIFLYGSIGGLAGFTSISLIDTSTGGTIASATNV